MGSGASRAREGQEHQYEEIRGFHRNCSIVTLDIKPGEWRGEQGAWGMGKGEQEGWEVEWGPQNLDSTWETSRSFSRCQSMDVKQLDSWQMMGCKEDF